jgi:hypothetical protein
VRRAVARNGKERINGEGTEFTEKKKKDPRLETKGRARSKVQGK